MSIHSKLLNIQGELKAPKSNVNDFGHYKYRSCEDILEAAKPCLQKAKCTLTLSDDVMVLGSRYYISANATLTDTETGEAVTVSAFAREEEIKKGMDTSQVTGAASSYARKYALNGLFCIDDTKDSDATNKGAPTCVDCGKEIKPFKSGGKAYTADQMADMAAQKYGRILCVDCARRTSAKDGDQ